MNTEGSGVMDTYERLTGAKLDAAIAEMEGRAEPRQIATTGEVIVSTIFGVVVVILGGGLVIHGIARWFQ
jgi:uncharacterized membrane protein YidH (DUF202 family)